MLNTEVIIVKDISALQFQQLALKSVRYALISIAFTYNRMEKTDLLIRINNIVKGKLAEAIFYFYCEKNNLYVDSKMCTTPFWMPDMRDFMWLGGEWDIKNNYIFCSDQDFKKFPFSFLPALIPNKNDHDQWSKRNDMMVPGSRFNAYLFTYMRLRLGDKTFFNLNISDDQIAFIHLVCQKYKQSPYGEMPFLESWFYEQMYKKGPNDTIIINYQPELIITGCANARYWQLFQPTFSSSIDNHYQNFGNSTTWYEEKGEILKFLNGAMVTKINNMTCPVALLPSFRSVLEKI